MDSSVYVLAHRARHVYVCGTRVGVYVSMCTCTSAKKGEWIVPDCVSVQLEGQETCNVDV